jgi:hypothetical protein
VHYHNGNEDSPMTIFKVYSSRTNRFRLTLVDNLYPQLPKYVSSVSHQAMLFGGDHKKSSFENCNILRLTASDGCKGAHGNKERDNSCKAAGEQWQTWSSICCIPLKLVCEHSLNMKWGRAHF